MDSIADELLVWAKILCKHMDGEQCKDHSTQCGEGMYRYRCCATCYLLQVRECPYFKCEKLRESVAMLSRNTVYENI